MRNASGGSFLPNGKPSPAPKNKRKRKQNPPPREKTIKISTLTALYVSDHNLEWALHAYIYYKFKEQSGKLKYSTDLFREYAEDCNISTRTARRRLEECIRQKWIGHNKYLGILFFRSINKINQRYKSLYDNSTKLGAVVRLFEYKDLKKDIRDMVFSMLVSGAEFRTVWRAKQAKKRGEEGGSLASNVWGAEHGTFYSAHSLNRMSAVTGKSVSTVKRRKKTTRKAKLLRFRNKSYIVKRYRSKFDGMQDLIYLRNQLLESERPYNYYLRCTAKRIVLRKRLPDEIMKYLVMGWNK